MNDFVSQLNEKLNRECLTEKCKKSNCSLNMQGAPSPFVLIDMDAEGAPVEEEQKKCDFLFLGGESEVWACPIEIKAGNLRNLHFLSQLQAGARVVEELVPETQGCRFRPLLLHGKGVHRGVVNRLRRSHVEFRGKKQGFKVIRCGKKLIEVLDSED